jgi:Ca-activated chloride channel family protein
VVRPVRLEGFAHVDRVSVHTEAGVVGAPVTFRSPGLLALLGGVGVVAVVYAISQLRRRRYVVVFSNVDVAAAASPGRARWRRHLAAVAFLVMLAAAVVAFARPVHDAPVARDSGSVVLALDVSYSMQATDVAPSRLAAAKHAATAFVRALPTKIHIGVVTFSAEVRTVVRPTIVRDVAIRAIGQARPAPGTAIGDALVQSLAALTNPSGDQGSLDLRGSPKARQIVARPRIVLLSDGESTAGSASSVGSAAAERAKVPVITIAFGTDQGRVDVAGQSFKVPVKQDELRAIAKATHGKYFRAATAQDLVHAYRDVGAELGFREVPTDLSAWFLIAALAAGLLALAGSLAWSERIP